MTAWYRREREQSRADSMRMTPEQRAWMYWASVDHHAMGGMTGPDPYIFGYDEHPSTRPAEHPEPAHVREIREILQGQRSTDRPWLSVLGLSWPCSIVDVRRAYRRLALVRHPDRGGSDAAFNALTKARDAALLAIA